MLHFHQWHPATRVRPKPVGIRNAALTVSHSLHRFNDWFGRSHSSYHHRGAHPLRFESSVDRTSYQNFAPKQFSCRACRECVDTNLNLKYITAANQFLSCSNKSMVVVAYETGHSKTDHCSQSSVNHGENSLIFLWRGYHASSRVGNLVFFGYHADTFSCKHKQIQKLSCRFF